MRVFARTALYGLCFLSPASLALAEPPPAEDVANALVAAMEARSGSEASYEAVAADNDAIVLTGVRLVEGSDDQRMVELPTLRLDGVSEREGGGYTVARVTFDGGRAVDGSRVVTWGAAHADNALLPGPEEIKSSARLRPTERMSIADIVVEPQRDPPLATVASMTVAMDEVVEDQPSGFTLELEGLTVDAALAGGTRRRALLEALGYDRITMDVKLASALDLEADTWVLSPLTLDVVDMGTFTVTGQFSGISPGGFVSSSRREAARDEAHIDGFEVRFENAGLVERALDMQAGMMGVERDQFVDQFLGAVPFMLNFIGNPPFQAKVATAANEFLRDPRVITISSTPEKPVPLVSVAGKVISDRAVLPDLLAVDILANQ